MIEIAGFLNASEVELIGRIQNFLADHGVSSADFDISPSQNLPESNSTEFKVQITYDAPSLSGGYANARIFFLMSGETVQVKTSLLEAVTFLSMLLTEGYLGLASKTSAKAAVKELRQKLRFLEEGCFLTMVGDLLPGHYIAPASEEQARGGHAHVHLMVDALGGVKTIAASSSHAALAVFLAALRHADRIKMTDKISVYSVSK